MKWEIFKNIILIILVFMLLFILSDDPKFNEFIEKRKINIFILLILIYFVYADFPLILIVIGLVIFIGLNPSFYKKYILENKILKKYNIQEYFENHEDQNKTIYENSYDIKPYSNDKLLSMESLENKIEENKEIDTSKKKIIENNEIKEEKMPFKKNVQDLREQFESIIDGFKTSD